MGNPPFVGGMFMSSCQKAEITELLCDFKSVGELDYVAGWYKKATDIMQGTKIRAAFVSTNSICQGEQVPILWGYLFKKYNITINFAYKSF